MPPWGAGPRASTRLPFSDTRGEWENGYNWEKWDGIFSPCVLSGLACGFRVDRERTRQKWLESARFSPRGLVTRRVALASEALRVLHGGQAGSHGERFSSPWAFHAR